MGLKSLKKNGTDNFDYILFSTIIVLLTIGIIMVYSASFYQAMIKENNGMYYFTRQLAFGIVGCVAMFILSRIDYGIWKKWVIPALVVAIIFLLLLLIGPKAILHSANGATRWIKLGPMTFQPSEIAKYAIVLYLAAALSTKGEKIKTVKGFGGPLLVAVLFAGLVLAHNNLSIASVIMFVTISMIFVAGAKLIHMGMLGLAGFCAGVLGIFIQPYRVARLMNFINPWKDAAGDGYQLIQSFYSLGAGGVVGLGLGKSRQKTMYMPEPHNDFIFSIIGEELGLIGCTFIIALFILFIYRGIKISIAAKDVYGTLLAVGITAIIAFQAIINIAVVSGSMPVTGVPLPFISYGGTSLVINLSAMGILLNISRQSKKTI